VYVGHNLNQFEGRVKVMRIYQAGPLFSEAERLWHRELSLAACTRRLSRYVALRVVQLAGDQGLGRDCSQEDYGDMP